MVPRGVPGTRDSGPGRREEAHRNRDGVAPAAVGRGRLGLGLRGRAWRTLERPHTGTTEARETS